jgi:hypothetical protein
MPVVVDLTLWSSDPGRWNFGIMSIQSECRRWKLILIGNWLRPLVHLSRWIFRVLLPSHVKSSVSWWFKQMDNPKLKSILDSKVWQMTHFSARRRLGTSWVSISGQPPQFFIKCPREENFHYIYEKITSCHCLTPFINRLAEALWARNVVYSRQYGSLYIPSANLRVTTDKVHLNSRCSRVGTLRVLLPLCVEDLCCSGSSLSPTSDGKSAANLEWVHYCLRCVAWPFADDPQSAFVNWIHLLR